eukprot:3867475-Rhodomonas_salina.1
MPTTPREGSASSSGDQDSGFPNKRTADGHRLGADQMDITSEAPAAAQQLQNQDSVARDSSRLRGERATRESAIGADDATGGSHGPVLDMGTDSDEKLEQADLPSPGHRREAKV